jgi:hypothetical protein
MDGDFKERILVAIAVVAVVGVMRVIAMLEIVLMLGYHAPNAITMVEEEKN